MAFVIALSKEWRKKKTHTQKKKRIIIKLIILTQSHRIISAIFICFWNCSIATYGYTN